MKKISFKLKIWTNLFYLTCCRCPLLYHCLIQYELRHTVFTRWNLKSLRKPGAGEETWNIPGTTDIYFDAVVKGTITSRGPSVTKDAAAAVCLCWSIPHLPVAQKTKGYLSLEALLWYISKCLFFNLAGKKKSSPFSFTVVLCHTDIQPKAPPGTRLHTSPSMLSNWHIGPS